MKKKAFFAGICGVMLAFGMALLGCGPITITTTPRECTVTFFTSDGTAAPITITVESGKTVDSLPMPTKTSGSDTVFWGWYTDNGKYSGNWGNPFTTLTIVKADITVYSRWGSSNPIKYTVTFNPDGGTVVPANIEVIAGDPAGTLPAPEKSGNTFGGWHTAQNGGGTALTEKTVVNADIEVYAKWTASGGDSGGGGKEDEDDDDSDDDNSGDGKDEYTLTWAVWQSLSYSDVSRVFAEVGAPLKPAGSNAGYLTGDDATGAYTIIGYHYVFDDFGLASGTFEDMLNYKVDDIGAPAALKNVMRAQRKYAPLGGVFQYPYGVVLFYIEKN
jgi:uncharacterized repeat protein (TIGR02543 family)